MKTSSTRVRARTRDVAYEFRMPAGIAGDINRSFAATVESCMISNATQGDNPTVFGVGLVIDAANHVARLPKVGDAALYGLFVRPYPTNSSQDGLGTSTPANGGVGDILRRGYMTIHLYGATAAVKGAKAYCRIQNAGAGQIIGGIEAAADGANTIDANAVFMGPADAEGNVEVAFNI